MRNVFTLHILPLIAVLPLAHSTEGATLAAQKPAAKPAEPLAAGTLPVTILQPLEAVAKDLAKGGREREMKDLLRALEKLGLPKANYDKLDKTCKDELAKTKKIKDAFPDGAKALRNAAKQGVVVMNGVADEEAKLTLARRILMLDGENAEAHAALGHVKVGGSWVAPDQAPLRERRGEILSNVDKAKKLVVDLERDEIDDPIIQQACGVKATVVRRGMIEFRSNFNADKTERMFREVQRALALSTWLKSGTLALPVVPKTAPTRRNVFYLIDSRERFKKLGDDLAASGKMTKDNIENWRTPNVETGAFNLEGGGYVMLAQFETDVQSAVMRSMAFMQEELPTPVSAGHLNWISLTCFGAMLGNQFYKEEKGKGFGDTSVAGDTEREREELMRLARAGIAGSRTWMRYLAERGEDPAFAQSFVQAIAAITGNDLHKCTSIVDYLQEAALFGSAYKSLCQKATGRPGERYNAALGMTVGDLESKWKDWLLGSLPGVAERIDKEDLKKWPKEALEILEYMNDIREKAFKDEIQGAWKLKFDPDLSEQCALHAHYLTLHPEQQKWPDAHEEYADKEGYTPEGHWAGSHSVIIWREGGEALTFKEGIDGWLGTFYHRLPLTDPGVLRLGWGAEEIYQVMDMSSLAAPYDKPFVVVYPYDGQTGVPTAFQGDEHPDPIPDGPPGSVNEGELYGYPITIQTNPGDERGDMIDIDMKLYEGKDKKKEVACFFSTPSKPTNPEIAPAGSWCLIPKTFLKPKATYTVEAIWTSGGRSSATSGGRRKEWTFTTN